MNFPVDYDDVIDRSTKNIKLSGEYHQIPQRQGSPSEMYKYLTD